MPQVIVTDGAVRGLERRRLFLAENNPPAARRAGLAIERQFAMLEITPEMGRPLADLSELRELIISFGDSGYVALFRWEPATDPIYVLAFRHQKEAGY